MAHCALPDLTFWVARSKVVNDMFELANIASISEEECWSKSDKERELRMKNSQYLRMVSLSRWMLIVNVAGSTRRPSTWPKESGSNSQLCSRGPYITKFDFASAEVKERRREEKLLKAKRRHEEHMPNFYVIQDPQRRRHDMNITFRDPHERRRNSSPTMHRPHGDQAKRDCRSHSPTRSGDHQNRAGGSNCEAHIRDEQRSSHRPDNQRHTSRHEDDPRTSSHRPDDPRSHSHRRDDKVMRAGKENPRK
ncbi:hypothetical protein ANCCAN_12410 [Ancylostoma caninum]|uniref:Uncharacterized protein n=1 Tax=Ancylostoma caninum TaxID=29170 RepID=A0A368GEZ6_ANCCA|nr:hypothetical protein ANCCAN_12410 [Ancylostoma caninum]